MSLEKLPDILTVDEVAAFLGVHENTIRKAMRLGTLPAVRLGRVLRIYKPSLVAWLNKQQPTS